MCQNQKNKVECCPVTARVSTDMNLREIKTSGHHNHLPPPVDIPMAYLRRSIGLEGTRFENKSTSARKIYNNLVVK